MVDYIYLGFYRFFTFLLFILPRWVTIKLMGGLAWLAYNISKKHQKIIQANLDLAFENTLSIKEKKSIGIDAFKNLIDTTFGIMSRERMSKEQVVKNITFEGDEIVQSFQREGKKIIFITGHQGNWELLSQAMAIHFNITLVGVGRKLDSELMDRVLKKNRERFNVEMVYKKGATKGCIKALSQGKAIGILVDQAIGKNQSIEVDFFGKKATHTPLASILSRKFDIALIPVFIETQDYQTYHVKIGTPLAKVRTEDKEQDLAVLTQLQSSTMEQAIKHNPKQWFWMHKRWK